MPTFKFYLNGKVYKQFSGAVSARFFWPFPRQLARAAIFRADSLRLDFMAQDERQLRAITEEIVRKAGQQNIEVTKAELTAYYEQYDKSKLEKVEEILAKYKHADLVKNLKAKYGKAPKTQKKKKYDPKEERKKKEEALKGASLRKATVEDLKEELERRGNGEAAGEKQPASAARTAEQDEDELEQMMAGMKAFKTKPNKLVVIGAGPAGLAAAVYAARAGLKPVVVAPPMGGQLMGKGVDVENFPGGVILHCFCVDFHRFMTNIWLISVHLDAAVEGSTGPSIVKQMRRQAFEFGTRFEFEMATSIDLSTTPFTVKTNTSTFTAQSLVVVRARAQCPLQLDCLIELGC